MTKALLPLYHLTLLRRAARDIQMLFAGRSSLQEIAARDLQRTLRGSFPAAQINDTAPVLLTPRYRYAHNTVISAGNDQSTLVDELINRFVDGIWVDYSLGQVLTDQPQETPVKASPLKNLNAQDAINQRGPRLLETCQQALLDDWAEVSIQAQSRLESLSLLLKQTLTHLSAPTLVRDAAQRRIINDVLQVPDNNLRTGTTRAYLVDQWGESGSQRLELLRAMVLVGPRTSGHMVMLFTLGAGIEVFNSFAELGAALLKLLSGLAPGRAMQWRLYEPRSNIFDSFALTFLAKQLSDLAQGVEIGRRSAYWGATMFDYVQGLVTADFDSLRIGDKGELSRLYGALPQWLKSASRDARVLFSQYLQDLGTLFQQANWKFFDDGIPSLLDFTRQQLMAAYPKRATLEPADIVITIHTVRGASAAGGFPVKNVTTLLQAALDNLAGLPGDAIQISLRDGSTAPSWLTRDAVKSLVSKVDIGENYPKVVGARLRGSSTEVHWRSRSFTQQMRLELPVLALEFYVRGRWGFTRKGYESVVAVMKAQAGERYLGNQVMVLRPLAFKTSATADADVVMNMFVIGPKSIGSGPVVLYRPMAVPKLMEFASRDDLLIAIGRPGALQQQVLAWMTADARATYRDNGFSAPHFNTLDGLVLLIDALTSKPALLAEEEVQGDYGQHLYQSQVQAILEQADRQSVSNRENLWARRMEGLSLGLNCVMPFVTGPLAVVGWLQVAWGVHEQLIAASQSGSDGKEEVLAGFFLNMALVLMHYSHEPISERFQARRRGEVVDEGKRPTLEVNPDGLPATSEVAENPVIQLPIMSAGGDTGAPSTAIAYGWLAVNRLTASQVADLKTFNVSRPTAATVSTRALTLGLFQHETQWYAEVEGYCFLVHVEGDRVRVVSATGRAGPWLKTDGKGRWSLDLRLRLMGGAPGPQPESSASLQALVRRFNPLFEAFTEAEVPELAVLESIKLQGNLETRLTDLERAADSTNLMLQRAKLLVDLLEQRRRLEVVQGYWVLRRRFLATQVRCLRFLVQLMELRRATLYKQLSDPADVYLLTLYEVAKRDICERLRQGLAQISTLHGQAVDTCYTQQKVFEELLGTVIPGQAGISVLDVPEWRGKVAVLAWQEAGLRPRVLRCLKARAVAPGVEALGVLQDVNLRCRLKLSSYRQLCGDPAFSAAEREQLLNETVDELAWLDTRLERMAAIRNSFIDLAALSDYRAYIRGLREEIVQDTLQHYAQQGAARQSGAGAPGNIIHSRHYGRLITGSRQQSQEQVAEFVDPYTGAVFARFGKTEVACDSDWEYRAVEPTGVISSGPQSYIQSWQMIQRGTAALERLPGLEKNLLISPRAVRAELELLAADLFEEVQRCAERQAESTHSDPLAVLLSESLTQKANELLKAARDAQHRMILARAPTAAGVEDLFREGAIDIKEVPDTKRVPGVGKPPLFRSFYIQKVKAGVATPEVLWFAHFHYAVEHTGSALDFISAHFKANTAQVAGFDQLLREAHADPEKRLRVYRATIDRETAQKLFFNGEIPSGQ